MKLLLLLSGPVAVGKSTIARVLTEAEQFRTLTTGSFLRARAAALGGPASRADLQALGDALDAETDYRWVVDAVAIPTFQNNPDQDRWLLDSVRKRQQVEHFRKAFPSTILHAHLRASEAVLESRYIERLSVGGEYEGHTPYDVAKNNPNELSARSLGEIADLTIDLTEKNPEEAAAAILDQWESWGNYASGRTN